MEKKFAFQRFKQVGEPFFFLGRKIPQEKKKTLPTYLEKKKGLEKKKWGEKAENLNEEPKKEQTLGPFFPKNAPRKKEKLNWEGVGGGVALGFLIKKLNLKIKNFKRKIPLKNGLNLE